MIIRKSKNLAELFEVSEAAVSRWISRGLPYSFADGRMIYKFELEKVIEWFLDQNDPRLVRFIEARLAKWEKQKNESKDI